VAIDIFSKKLGRGLLEEKEFIIAKLRGRPELAFLYRGAGWYTAKKVTCGPGETLNGRLLACIIGFNKGM